MFEQVKQVIGNAGGYGWAWTTDLSIMRTEIHC